MYLTNFHFYNNKNYLYSKPVKGLQGCEIGYGFAFNGKENDNETYGEGNSYDFGARIYDPRLGRWMSVDPLFMKFVDYSPYCGMSNSPISIIDIDGRDIILFFYSQRTSASGAGHVAVAVGQNDKRLSYFTHYPVHENAPGGANIVGQISLTGAMNYDKEKGLQTSGPALVIRIKTDNDADIDAKVAMVMMLQNNWSAFTANCSDGANAACSSVGIQPTSKGESHISSPAVVAFSLIEKMTTDSRISIISGDAKKFKEENLASATMSVGFTSLFKLTDAVYSGTKSVINKVSNAIKKTIDGGNNFVKDVKNKTEEGVKSLDKIGKPQQ